jgi:hypothetical protein
MAEARLRAIERHLSAPSKPPACSAYAVCAPSALAAAAAAGGGRGDRPRQEVADAMDWAAAMGPSVPYEVTAAHRADFQERGFVVLESAFSAAQITQVDLGLGRIVALCYGASTLYQMF